MARRGQTDVLSDQIYRYRGIVALVSVPIVLLIFVFIVMPGIKPYEGVSGGSELDDVNGKFNDLASDKDLVPASGDSSEKYAVVIDAGSTGSRIHVYRFDAKLQLMEVGGELELFVAIKPGLSFYKDDPKAAAESLRQLLKKALAVVPETTRPTTPVVVGATAGLRFLPGDTAAQILDEVRNLLNEYPFTFQHDDVKILDGADEGSFAWVTVNYLLGSLGKDLSETVGVVDLGGGSVQMTYAVPEAVAGAAPEGYVRKLSGLGKTYNVYVHSYLGFGLMAARAQVLKAQQEDTGHACLHKGADTKYTYAGEELVAKARASGASVSDCTEVAVKAIRVEEKCSFDSCSFNGTWSGGLGPGAQRLFIASYFFDRAGQVRAIPDPKVSSAPVKPAHYHKAASEVCEASVDEVTVKFEGVDAKDAPFLCLDVVYQHTLLTKGLGIPNDKEVTLVKQIKYKGKDVEAAWPLGAAINALA